MYKTYKSKSNRWNHLVSERLNEGSGASSRGAYREDLDSLNQLPTPATTPAPFSNLDESDAEIQSESHSETSNSTVHSDQTTVPVMASVPIDTDTPAQKQSIKVNSILHKITINTKLSATNYNPWSDDVRFGLAAASYDQYLIVKDVPTVITDPEVILATKKCIFHWLLASMESAQSTRFISMISTFENGIKNTPSSPFLLWKTVRDYHISNSESVKLMLRSDITDLSQGSTKDLLEYIDMFRAKIDAYLGANGEMSEEEQARQFVRSLNRDWAEKGCDLLDAGHVKFRNLETELKKTYQTPIELHY
ncbi:uncharacterized protein MELLADRAFT_61736 [Melampsora larici-populina 98AG31]|uniref:Uncharacterized protein n=1 Tax=Melampsora larici-populina (strain 98AG31 / pathotype 3-4-7) TaxID=747676 RepID=F4RFY0_MELLP|nr:uncharacterized protein MELLADRAFT_61736 [Melampsora larici-populina 98AG31]EGG08679.1 hypothetical protein MELLADRAFT_61736 [Melampsora larici-populina 98AG31]